MVGTAQPGRGCSKHGEPAVCGQAYSAPTTRCPERITAPVTAAPRMSAAPHESAEWANEDACRQGKPEHEDAGSDEIDPPRPDVAREVQAGVRVARTAVHAEHSVAVHNRRTRKRRAENEHRRTQSHSGRWSPHVPRVIERGTVTLQAAFPDRARRPQPRKTTPRRTTGASSSRCCSEAPAQALCRLAGFVRSG
jgi:hypothetical protein